MTQLVSAEQNYILEVQAKIRCGSCGKQINKFLARGQGKEKFTCDRECSTKHYVICTMFEDLAQEFELRTNYERKGRLTKHTHNYVLFALAGIKAGVPSILFNEGIKQIRKGKATPIKTTSKLYKYYLKMWSIRI